MREAQIRNKVHSKCYALESSPNHFSIPGPWKNYLPWNWSLVLGRLGTAVLEFHSPLHSFIPLSSLFEAVLRRKAAPPNHKKITAVGMVPPCPQVPVTLCSVLGWVWFLFRAFSGGQWCNVAQSIGARVRSDLGSNSKAVIFYPCDLGKLLSLVEDSVSLFLNRD